VGEDNAFLGKRKRGSEAVGCVVNNSMWLDCGGCIGCIKAAAATFLVSHYHHVLNYYSVATFR